MYVFSKRACRQMDRDTIEKCKIDSLILMEVAGERISRKVKNLSNNFLIFSGIGNNGGDGLVIARKLFLENKRVKVIICGDIQKASKEFLANYNINKNIGVLMQELDSSIKEEIFHFDVIIDAVFGNGLNREIKNDLAKCINLINQSKKFVVSIDIPSGLDGDTGRPLRTAIRANKTFVIEVLKRGFLEYTSMEFIGEIEIIKIGIPKSIKNENSEGVYILEKEEYIKKIPKRKKYAHKGNAGKVAIIGGCIDYIGAPYITGEASLKTGSGLVTIFTSKEISHILKSKVIETMVKEYDKDLKDLESFDVIGCGVGLGKSKIAVEVVSNIIENKGLKKLVLDADALNIISEKTELLEKISGRAILTPHLGEMARLTNKSIEEIEKNKIDIAKEFAKKFNVILLLKGLNTIITDGKNVYVNPTGSSKMASGGMGDCLTGMITSFVGQGLSLIDSALLAAYIHGTIGDRLGERLFTVNASDIIKNISSTLEEILCEK